MKVRILVCSYTFPPDNGIGGRRWSKFYKCLKETGHEVYVLSRAPAMKDSLGSEQIINEGNADAMLRLDFNYPSIMNRSDYSLMDKVQYRISRAILRFLYKGNIYDNSCLFKLSNHPEIAKLVEENKITHVVVSGGPFYWMTELLLLKNKFPSIQLLADFRDPWMSNRSFFGYAELNSKRRAFESRNERSVIEGYDKIISVSSEMNEYFIETYGVSRSKFFTIPNGWDRDEVYVPQNKEKTKRNIVFAGTLYERARYAFEAFITYLNDEEIKRLVEVENIQFDFYGNMPNWFFEQKHPRVNYKGRLESSELNKILAKSSGGMLFLTEDLSFSLSTKFFEYLKYGLPIFVFGKSGATSDFVESKGIGIGVPPKNGIVKMKELIDLCSSNINPASEWINEFEIRSLTNQLLNVLHESP